MSPDPSKTIDVLIVDDEKQIHTLLTRMLRSQGLKQLYCAYSASEALRVLRSRPVNFLITDWIMPQMTGIELIRIIRKDPDLFNIPIMVLTGLCSAEGVICAMEEGADGYVLKPFSARKIQETIHQIREKHANCLQKAIDAMASLKLQGKFQDAVAVGRRILETQRDPNALFLLAECLGELGQYKDAMSVLEETARAEKCGRSNNLLGKLHMKQGNHEQGLTRLKLASEQCDLNLARKVDLAQAYFELGEDAKAESVIGDILKSKPTNLIMADLGNVYLAHGDLEKAASFLKDGATPTPETVHVFNNYAIALRRRGMFRESEDIYKKCITLIPDSYALYFNLGMLYNQTKAFGKAAKMFEETLRINPACEPASVLLNVAREKKKAKAAASPSLS